MSNHDRIERLKQAHHAIAQAAMDVARATAAIDEDPEDERKQDAYEDALVNAAMTLAEHAETVMAALVIAAGVEQTAEPMGFSPIDRVRRNGRGRLH
jgi:7,8-dihydro-6-hydroxymethylpterin-pyrophosphokinase